MTRLIIARHGNTFEKGEVPTRVGSRTDLPLTSFGLEQARRIGNYLRSNELLPDVVFSSPLRRAFDTAKEALSAAGLPDFPITVNDIFTEIDYGPDENKTDLQVISRIGQRALDDWNNYGTVPEGWLFDKQTAIDNWLNFADFICTDFSGKNVFVTTSNGIARFSPYITGDFDNFCSTHGIKIGTGCLCIFCFKENRWVCEGWNIKP